MTRQLTDRYREAKLIAMAAIELGMDAREEMIASAVAGDEELGREVRWMIGAIESSHTAPMPGDQMQTADLSGHDAQASAPRHYRLLRRLGEGGMGTVYLAERTDGDFVQQVALKFLQASAEGSPVLLERFTRERQVLARLEHPGIAHLLDGGVLTDGKPFLAMEYVEGERIDAWCEHHGADLRERVLLFLKVCAAVEYAHRNLIIHRDIKPANILVTEYGEPKLLDFGIARIIDEHVDVAATATGAQALTLAYASPEQIERQPLTTAADVYSLGVVLYQLVSGRRPFQHLVTPHLLTNAIIGGVVVAPSRVAKAAAREIGGEKTPGFSVPADIDAIVLKSLRRHAAERYATVGELVADLRRFLARHPVHARRGVRLYRVRRFVQRNRWPLAAASVLLVAVLSGLGSSLYALGQARTQQQLAEHRQQQLERIVHFQQSMFDSVDIDAMGHAIKRDQERQLTAMLSTGKDGPVPDKGAVEELQRAFAGISATDTARNVLDTYVVTHALDSLDAAFADAPTLAADMRQSLARVLVNIGSYPHAVTELRKVLSTRDQGAPADDQARLSTQIDLAQALYRKGDLDAAAELFGQSGRESSSLPVAAPLRVAAEAGRGRVLAAQGHLQQALVLQQKLYEQLQPLLPATDTGVMELRQDLVSTLIGLGMRDEARKQAEALVALDRGKLGAEHPETLRAMVVLAKLLHYRHEYEKSLALAREVANIRERKLGADHPETLRAQNMVATDEVYLAQDPVAFKQAHVLLDRVLATRERLLGPDHPDTMSSRTVMVRLLSKQGHFSDDPAVAQAYFAQAIKQERGILASHERVLGPDHPHTLMAHGSLASLLSAAGQYREALAEAELTLAGQRRVLGEKHPIVFSTLTLIGDINSDAGNWKAARVAYQQALNGREKLLGLLDAHTIESATRLHDALDELRDGRAANDIRRRYLDPVIALNPADLNASMRGVREQAIRTLTP
ncbi:serine/threonine protein kinase [Rhodanobacter sp. Root480]|uniref:serine/threonine-protein kinase n=1 Tax=Rhodanobacter sp. Root480 TaxID=1736542 RepID=UPI0006F2C8B4|nr:serine/threonine-protein kinase [Rhodanobacter sp. Root480]KQX96542.1 serine/threonine protein kinase [Rhodanobacter sp. Root480]